MKVHTTVGERLIKLCHFDINSYFDSLVHRIARGYNIARNKCMYLHVENIATANKNLKVKLFKLCGPLTVVVNVFKCVHANIVAFTSQT